MYTRESQSLHSRNYLCDCCLYSIQSLSFADAIPIHILSIVFPMLPLSPSHLFHYSSVSHYHLQNVQTYSAQNFFAAIHPLRNADTGSPTLVQPLNPAE